MAATLPGSVAIGAVADHRIGAGNRHVGDRQAIDVDAERRKIGGDQAGAKPRRGEARVAIAVVERAIGGAGRIGRPVRRTKALNPAALLIDQHRGVASERIARRHRSAAAARRAGDIALEDNETPRLRFAEECALAYR